MSGPSVDGLLHELYKLQLVIDVSADRLVGLRTQCEPTASLTQQEIRTVEGKLIKLFSSQLLLKEKLAPYDDYTIRSRADRLPKLSQWLTVVGLHEDAIKCVCSKIRSVEELQAQSEHDMRLLLPSDCSEEQVRRLARALHNLRRFSEVLRRDAQAAETLDSPLHWDSWDDKPAAPSPRLLRSRNVWVTDEGNRQVGRVPPPAPQPSKPDTVWKQPKSPVDPVVPKSRSHEFQPPPEDNGEVSSAASKSAAPTPAPRARLATEPGPLTAANMTAPASPLRSPPVVLHDPDKNLQVPKSPRTPTLPRPGVMGHTITHRFTKTFKVMTTCNYCEKQMFGTGLKCIDCSYICHRDCEPKVPPSCRLPKEMLDEYILANHSPHVSRSAAMSPKRPANRFSHNSRKASNSQPAISIPPFSGYPDSSSTSSCNSSTPSSPAVMPIGKQQFLYPDVDRGVTLETHPLAVAKAEEIGSRDSDKTISASGSGSFSLSTDSDRTPVRVDSQDSQVSDGETDRGWPRQNSLSIREWDIPYDELNIGELVGRGRFGNVYRGNWHGDVAVKVLNMNYLEDEKRLDAFKLEVATFRKTRHENLILFMGACVKPEHFAIVTSFSKGMTLYTHIHTRHEKFYLNKNIGIAQQISQGMGYLHDRGIIHRDLKSKNIFLENGKVVMTDFGLFGVSKLCYGCRQDRDGLIIPPGWLCYLSSELMTSLRSSYQPDEELPFSEASDVYAFGTVWYELLCGDWPFKGQPPESIIWQVGRGMKQSLANLQASRDVKDILMMCWSYRASDRPDFSTLLKMLEKLPKKKLARSPSHPIHLSRSAESVF